MRYTRCNVRLTADLTINKDLLSSLAEEVVYPLKSVATYSIVLDLMQEKSMGDFIESFGKVEKDEISLSLLFQSSGQVIDGEDELCVTRASFTESMLCVGQDFMLREVVDNSTVYDMLA